MLRAFIALAFLSIFLLSASAATAAVTYAVEIVGVEDDALLQTMRESSALVAREGVVDSLGALQRRAVADARLMRQVASSAGYYDAKVVFEIDENVAPMKVTLKVEPGNVYRLAAVHLAGPNGETVPLIGDFDPAAVGLAVGEAATAAPIVDAEGRIATFYTERGRPFAKVLHRRAVIDRGTQTMEVTYTVDTGPAARFGAVTVSGLESLDQGYVDRQLGWADGDPYDSRKVEATRKALVDSTLFSTVMVQPVAPVVDDRVPMRIELIERPARSIGAGVQYDTTDGFGGRVFWEHRNLLGNAEKLRIEGKFGETGPGLTSTFRRPGFLYRNMDLVANVSLLQERVDAYNSTRGQAGAGVEYHLTPRLTFGSGPQFERAHVESDEGTEDYSLIGLPSYLRYDGSDNTLDPTRGWRAGLSVTPYRPVTAGPINTFVTSRLNASNYLRLTADDRVVLASFAAIGSIVGTSLDSLPRDKRLYAGGSGSVRGYGYQRAGPLDENAKPIGGRSSFEVGTELRTKITDTIGAVAFFEGASVTDREFPDFSQKMLWGTGVGARYYSPIGPVRFDIAFPLERRSGDAAFQLYISLGQAF